MKKRKKRVNVTNACGNCKRFHTSCDENRPCLRCLERGVECVEGVSKKRGRKTKYEETTFEEEEEQIKETIPCLDVYQVSTNDNNSFPVVEETNLCWLNSLPESDTVTILQKIEEPQYIQNTALYRGIPDINETPSTFCRKEFNSFLIVEGKQRGPNVFAEKMEVTLHQLEEQMIPIRKSITQEVVKSMWSDFYCHFLQFVNGFKDMGIPTLVFERNGIIHYANPSYRQLTLFSKPVPTLISDLELMHQLSNRGVQSFSCMILSILDQSIGKKNSHSFQAGVRIEGTNEFIEGTMCISFKRDSLGLPLIFLANFLPSLSCKNQLLT